MEYVLVVIVINQLAKMSIATSMVLVQGAVHKVAYVTLEGGWAPRRCYSL